MKSLYNSTGYYVFFFFLFENIHNITQEMNKFEKQDCRKIDF